jgi:HSP90 family molecular chaperone
VSLCSQIGIIEDQENRERLSKLLRFFSSKSEGDNLVGLEEYIGRMKEGQKGIYYMVSGVTGSASASARQERTVLG